jgi:thioredoxin reductase (NADPH)
MYDIIVIGAGPAGLTAAIYARRAEKSVLVIEKANFGGQMTHSPKIENYPAFTQISGLELADKMVEQALELGAEIEPDEVTSVSDMGEFKRVTCEGGSFDAKAVIIAVGVKHRQLGLERENELCGNGVSYCAVCDGAFYKGKTVGVVGGGNSALQEAILLSETSKKVYLIQNLDFLTGEVAMQNKIASLPNVEVILGTTVKKLNGEPELTSVTVETKNGESDIALDGLFVAIGLLPKNEIFSEVAKLNDGGYFDSDESCLTATKGFFVAGDCRQKSIRQITTATADGATAALAACRYLESL